jgi:bla regulator protein BlaR1
MITYVFKTIVCSAFLIIIYYLFLEKEKMHRFNRFYLLFSIAFSFIAPLITIKIRSTGYPISETINLANSSFQNSVSQQIMPSLSNNFTFSNILLLIYITVTVFLFFRFIINISVIFFKIKNSKSVQYLGAKIVLTNDNYVPHSFLKFVFVNFKDFESGTIEKEIIGHELTHVRQKHSLDILFIELLTIIAWINPLLFLYRKAVQLNHEFLADEFVVNKLSNTQTYQLLLLDKAKQTNNLLLSSPFNYLLTKKRIIMMSKNRSHKVAFFKQIALIPIIVATGFIFSTKSVAQEPVKPVQQAISQTDSTPELTKFLILVETTDDGIILTSEQGCAFKKLTFTLKDDNTQAVDQFGMSSLNRDKTVKNSNLANFLFTIKKTKEGLSFEGIEGTAWKKLSFSCPKGKCYQYIDQYGMTDVR